MHAYRPPYSKLEKASGLGKFLTVFYSVQEENTSFKPALPSETTDMS